MRALVFVYIIENVAHAHAQNAHIERFSSTPGLGVVPRHVERDQLVAYLVINICGLDMI